VLKVDDLNVESLSNQISTAIPGVTLTVKGAQATAQNLVISGDTNKSKANLQTFVDAYNAIVNALGPSLRPDPNNPPADGTVLDGQMAVGLEQRMHNLLSTKAVTNGTVRTLADMGVKLQNDGTLTIVDATFNKAIGTDPAAVDAVFSTAATGVGAQVSNLSKGYTDPIDGQLIQRKTSLGKTIKDLQAANVRQQNFVDNFKQQLLRQFSVMESTISSLNSISTFLNASSANSSSGSK